MDNVQNFHGIEYTKQGLFWVLAIIIGSILYFGISLWLMTPINNLGGI